MSNKPVVIYTLCDPDTGEVKYIGQTHTPGSRYNNHLSGPIANNNPKRIWIDSLIDNGKLPIMRILKIVPKSQALRIEMQYIRKHSRSLLNSMHNPLNDLSHRRTTETKERGTLCNLELDTASMNQLAAIQKHTGLTRSTIISLAIARLTQSEVISTALDRMYQQEIGTMKEIKVGEINDLHIFAIEADGRYYPMKALDRMFEKADAKIYYDSGIYPGVTNLPQYICDKARNT